MIISMRSQIQILSRKTQTEIQKVCWYPKPSQTKPNQIKPVLTRKQFLHYLNKQGDKSILCKYNNCY